MPGNYGPARTRIERSGKLHRRVACGAAPDEPPVHIPCPAPSSTEDYILETDVRTREEVGSSPTLPPHLVRRTAALRSGYEIRGDANIMRRKTVRLCSSPMTASGAEKLREQWLLSQKLQYEHAGDKKENRRDTEKQGRHHMTHQICDSPSCSFPFPPMSPRGVCLALRQNEVAGLPEERQVCLIVGVLPSYGVISGAVPSL